MVNNLGSIVDYNQSKNDLYLFCPEPAKRQTDKCGLNCYFWYYTIRVSIATKCILPTNDDISTYRFIYILTMFSSLVCYITAVKSWICNFHSIRRVCQTFFDLMSTVPVKRWIAMSFLIHLLSSYAVCYHETNFNTIALTYVQKIWINDLFQVLHLILI